MRGYICWFFASLSESISWVYLLPFSSSSQPSSRTGIIVINICTYILSTTTHFRTKNHTRTHNSRNLPLTPVV
ncbi:hypothetical protein GGI35DRAFT_154436 [Trichoderma velutinum]